MTLPLRADVLLSNAVFGELDDGISEEFLRNYTRNDNLEKIDNLELQVDCVNGAQRVECIGELLPNLQQLRLNHSNVSMLRDLGTGLSQLRVLWLCRSALKDLGGIGAMPALEELYVSFNDIHDLSPLLTHEALQVLDLEANLIEDFGEIRGLEAVTTLRELTLGMNPVCRHGDFSRDRVLDALPQLEVLDDVPRGAQASSKDVDDLAILTDFSSLLEIHPLTGDDFPCNEIDNLALKDLRQRAGRSPAHSTEELSQKSKINDEDISWQPSQKNEALLQHGSKKRKDSLTRQESKKQEAWFTEGRHVDICAVASVSNSSKAIAELRAGQMQIRAASAAKGMGDTCNNSKTEPSEQDLIVERLKSAPRPVPSLWSFQPAGRVRPPTGLYNDRPHSSAGSLSTSYRPTSASSGTTSGKSGTFSSMTEESSSSDLTTGDDGAALAGNPLAAIRRRRRTNGTTAEEELGIRNLLRKCESSVQGGEISAHAKFQANDDIVQAKFNAFTKQGESLVPNTPQIRVRKLTSSHSKMSLKGAIKSDTFDKVFAPSFTTKTGEVLVLE